MRKYIDEKRNGTHFVSSSFQVWPDYPNVTVDESLDWDTQVQVQLVSL